MPNNIAGAFSMAPPAGSATIINLFGRAGSAKTCGAAREGGMQEIAHKPLSCGPVVRFDRLTPEDGESGMLPAEQKIDDPGGDDLLGQTPQRFPMLSGKYLGQKEPGETPKVFAKGIVSTHSMKRAVLRVAFGPPNGIPLELDS